MATNEVSSYSITRQEQNRKDDEVNTLTTPNFTIANISTDERDVSSYLDTESMDTENYQTFEIATSSKSTDSIGLGSLVAEQYKHSEVDMRQNAHNTVEKDISPCIESSISPLVSQFSDEDCKPISETPIELIQSSSDNEDFYLLEMDNNKKSLLSKMSLNSSEGSKDESASPSSTEELKENLVKNEKVPENDLVLKHDTVKKLISDTGSESLQANENPKQDDLLKEKTVESFTDRTFSHSLEGKDRITRNTDEKVNYSKENCDTFENNNNFLKNSPTFKFTCPADQYEEQVTEALCKSGAFEVDNGTDDFDPKSSLTSKNDDFGSKEARVFRRFDSGSSLDELEINAFKKLKNIDQSYKDDLSSRHRDSLPEVDVLDVASTLHYKKISIPFESNDSSVRRRSVLVKEPRHSVPTGLKKQVSFSEQVLCYPLLRNQSQLQNDDDDHPVSVFCALLTTCIVISTLVLMGFVLLYEADIQSRFLQNVRLTSSVTGLHDYLYKPIKQFILGYLK